MGRPARSFLRAAHAQDMQPQFVADLEMELDDLAS